MKKMERWWNAIENAEQKLWEIVLSQCQFVQHISTPSFRGEMSTNNRLSQGTAYLMAEFHAADI